MGQHVNAGCGGKEASARGPEDNVLPLELLMLFPMNIKVSRSVKMTTVHLSRACGTRFSVMRGLLREIAASLMRQKKISDPRRGFFDKSSRSAVLGDGQMIVPPPRDDT